MRFDYLKPSIGPVVDLLEDHEKIYALDQPEYTPLRTLPGEDGMSAIYRCDLTPEQRQMIADGADILVEILHFKGPLAPSRVMLLNQQNLDVGKGESKESLAEWFGAQTKGPYHHVES
jgi:hypothetical protein